MIRFSRAGSSASDTRTVRGRYRRAPGGWLLVALLVVPFVLALLGTMWPGGTDDAPAQQTAGAAASAGPTPPSDREAIEVRRDEGRIAVSGRVPDAAAERGLLDSVRAAAGDARVVDEVEVEDGVRTPPLPGVGTVLAAARGIEDVAIRVDGSTVALSGTAPDQRTATATVFAAGQSYPGLNLQDGMNITGSTGPAAAGPAAPLTQECAAVRDDVAARLQAEPVTFTLGGAEVDEASTTRLTDLGRRLAGCTFTSVEVAGHTDDTGADAHNVTLSGQRAQAVREIIVVAGVPGDVVTARGYGASRPVADNSTDTGRAANRRVEILAQ